MGFAIHPALIVLLIMVGSAVAVMMGYAVHKLVGFNDSSDGFKPRTQEQEIYMREVRDRNVDGLMVEGRRSAYKNHGPGPKQM